jgi:hypothetical protein
LSRLDPESQGVADPDISQDSVACFLVNIIYVQVTSSVMDPDPDLVFGPPGSESISQRYGPGSFYHQAKIVRKTLIPTVL